MRATLANALARRQRAEALDHRRRRALREALPTPTSVLTEIDHDFEGDTFAPTLDAALAAKASRSSSHTAAKDGHALQLRGL